MWLLLKIAFTLAAGIGESGFRRNHGALGTYDPLGF